MNVPVFCAVPRHTSARRDGVCSSQRRRPRTRPSPLGELPLGRFSASAAARLSALLSRQPQRMHMRSRARARSPALALDASPCAILFGAVYAAPRVFRTFASPTRNTTRFESPRASQGAVLRSYPSFTSSTIPTTIPTFPSGSSAPAWRLPCAGLPRNPARRSSASASSGW